MAPILALPQETILEIAKALDIKEAFALISTCKALYAITQARPFWVDQLLRLCEIFRPLIPHNFASLSVEDLRAMVTTPYRFEQTVMQGKLREIPSVRLKRDPFTELLNAVIVPGGHWIVTADMNLVQDGPGLSFVRLWRLVPESSPQDAFPCIASKQMPTGYRPMEMCVTAGEGSLDLLVLVNSFKPGFWEQGCYIQVLNINLAAEEPEFVVLAEMKPGISYGVRFQGDSVVGELQPEGEQREFLIWDWKTGESRTLPSPGDRGSYWFIAASERACTIWDAVDECIEVHWSDPHLGHDQVERHLPPPPDDDQESDEGHECVRPILCEFRDRSGDRIQTALARLPLETVWAKIEDCGEGRISFLRYRIRRNLGSDEWGPRELQDPLSELVMTASGHLLTISSSGLLRTYRTEDCESLTNLGESVSYYPFAGDDRDRYPFVCPFSGILGSVNVYGDLHLWQQK